MTLEAILLKELQGILWGALRSALGKGLTRWREERQLKHALDTAMAKGLHELEPFFTAERLEPARLRVLARLSGAELALLLSEPDRLFRAALNPDRVWADSFDAERPESIVQEGLERPFELLARSVIAGLCQLAAEFEPWFTIRHRVQLELQREVLDASQRPAPTLDADAASARDEQLSNLLRSRMARECDRSSNIAGRPDERRRQLPLDAVFVHPRLVREACEGRRNGRNAIEDLDAACRQLLPPGARTLVTAGPATGKSVWLRALQLDLLAREDRRLPLRVELGDLSLEDLPTLPGLLATQAGPNLGSRLSHELSVRWLESGRVVLLLDGFDQLPLEARSAVAGWIAELDLVWDRCAMLLASRALSTPQLGGLGAHWDRWCIELLDRARIVAHVLRWQRNLGVGEASVADAEDLVRGWTDDPLVEPLTRTPISLYTLLAVRDSDTPTPKGRAHLYRSYMDSILAARGLEGPIHRRLLQVLALGFTVTHPDRLDHPACLALLEREIEDQGLDWLPSDTLSLLCERSGLLTGPADPSFLHRNLADLLVAELVLRGDGHDARGRRIDRLTLFRHRDDDLWNGALFFWADMAPLLELQHFVQACLERPDWEDWALALGLAEDQRWRLGDDLLRRVLQRLVDNPPDPEQENSVPTHSTLLHECPGPYAELLQAASVDLVRVRSVSGWSGKRFAHGLYLRHEHDLTLPADPDRWPDLLEQYHWLANLACDESGRWFDALLAPPLLDIDELDLQSICLFHRVVQLLRTERGTELAELVGLARDPLPELASRAAFLIMAAMHWCANTMLGGQQQLVEDALCGLQACREGRVDGRWLAGSHIFCVDTFSDGHHTVDILLDTAARLREAPDTPTTREITGWLDQLLQRREMRRNR